MANVDNFRTAEADLATAPVGSSDVVYRGDMVGLSSGAVKCASDTTWDTNLATTQTAFAKVFIGVAMEDSASGETAEILIREAGVFEFDCAAATFDVGDLVGPDDSGSSTLMDQQVEAVATIDLAIGRVAKDYASNTTKVLVKLLSTLGGYRAKAEL